MGVETLLQRDMKPKVKRIYDILDAYNTAAALLDEAKFVINLSQYKRTQCLQGINFKVNVAPNDDVTVVIQQKKVSYDEVDAAEKALNELGLKFKVNLEAATKQVTSKFVINLAGYENDVQMIMEIFDIVKPK